YIQAGAGSGPTRPVLAFVEKPDLATAQRYIADPDFSWNAGMFLFQARAFLEEARRLKPELAAIAEAAVRDARVEGDLVRLDDGFCAAPSISIDYAVMEHTHLAQVVTCDMGWSDVGAWRALWEQAQAGPDHNALIGEAMAVGATGCLVRSDGPVVAVAGVEDL